MHGGRPGSAPAREGAVAGDRLRPGLGAGLCLYLLAHLVHAIVVRQALAADGAAVLLRVAGSRSLSSLDTNRIVADALLQWPVILASRLGVTDLRILADLLGIGQTYLVPLSLGLAWALLPRDRRELMLFPLLWLLLGWMASGFYGIHQANVAALLFWPVFIAVRFRPLDRWRDVALLAALALPMAALYDSIVVTGPLLAAVAAWRYRTQRDAAHRWVWAALVLWFLAAAAISLGFVLHPRNPFNRADFFWGLRTGAVLLDREHAAVNWPLAIALAGLPLLGLAAWRPALLLAGRRVWLPAYLLFCGFAALAPVLSPSTFSTVPQFQARSITSLLPAGLAILLLLAAARRWRPAGDTARLLALILPIMAAAEITWQSAATAQWAGYLKVFRATLAANRGPVAFESTPLAERTIGIQALRAQVWGWTNPWLSIALAPGGHVAAIVSNAEGRSAGSIDPTRAAGLPPIAGVEYGEYVAALGGPH
jgi:hypothetical protein